MDNTELIQAYLLLQGNRYKEKFDTISLLEKISKEVELVEKELEKKEPTNENELDNEKLLVMLGGKIATGEIKHISSGFLYEEDHHGTGKIILELATGKTEPDRINKFFEKHGLNKKNEDKRKLKE